MEQNRPRKVSDTTRGQGTIQHKQLFYFAAAAALGDIVVMDRSTTTYGLGSAAKTSPATADFPEVLGAIDYDDPDGAVVAGTWRNVVTFGVAKVKAASDIDAGDPVCTTGTAGTCRELVEGTDGNRIGFALEDDGAVTAGYARIFVQLGG